MARTFCRIATCQSSELRQKERILQDECILVSKIPHKCELVNYVCMLCACNQSFPVSLDFTNQFRELLTFLRRWLLRTLSMTSSQACKVPQWVWFTFQADLESVIFEPIFRWRGEFHFCRPILITSPYLQCDWCLCFPKVIVHSKGSWVQTGIQPFCLCYDLLKRWIGPRSGQTFGWKNKHWNLT